MHVAFTPGEATNAQLGIVVDVLRATSTIAQALASGYERVYCCREIDEARALRDRLGEGLLGGERNAVRIDGFDVGASPREFVGEPRASTVIFSTTNGTRANSLSGFWKIASAWSQQPARSTRRSRNLGARHLML